MSLAPDDPRHGTDSAYTRYACRCSACRAAHTAANRAYRRRNDLHVRLGTKAERMAAQWVKVNMPDLWRQIRRTARDEIEAARQSQVAS